MVISLHDYGYVTITINTLHDESIRICNGFYIVVPPGIRKKLDIKPDEIIGWKLDVDTRIIVLSFREKESIMDLAGIVKMEEESDAVELKHKAQRGKLGS